MGMNRVAQEVVRDPRVVKALVLEIERLWAVVDAVDYLRECWRESGDSADWGNALPNLFDRRAALEKDDE
jgi:hypothetical protein